MIIGFHLTWTTYGHWFPNDPRGSWSDEVWKPQLEAIRELDAERRIIEPESVPQEELQAFLDAARTQLKWPTVQLAETEVPVAAKSFAQAASLIGLEIFACAIMSNHVHLVVERHRDSYERIVNRLKGQASQEIRRLRGYPSVVVRRDRVPIWTDRYWVRYIAHDEQMECAIEYVRNNPVRERLPEQKWDFVCQRCL
jgi:REP element-mobilizing transposase RayT